MKAFLIICKELFIYLKSAKVWHRQTYLSKFGVIGLILSDLYTSYLQLFFQPSHLHLKCCIHWLYKIWQCNFKHKKAMKYLFCCTQCCTFVSRCTQLKTLYLQHFHSFALLYKSSITFLNSYYYGISKTNFKNTSGRPNRTQPFVYTNYKDRKSVV